MLYLDQLNIKNLSIIDIDKAFFLVCLLLINFKRMFHIIGMF